MNRAKVGDTFEKVLLFFIEFRKLCAKYNPGDFIQLSKYQVVKAGDYSAGRFKAGVICIKCIIRIQLGVFIQNHWMKAFICL